MARRATECQHGFSTRPTTVGTSSPVSSCAALSVPSHLISGAAWELDEVVEVSVADHLPQFRHCPVGVVARAVDEERLAVMTERHVAAAFLPVPEKRGAPGEVGMR